MSESSAAVRARTTTSSDLESAPLDPISEDRTLQTRSTSPVPNTDKSNRFDFASASDGYGPKRSSTGLPLSPNSTKKHEFGPKPGAKTAHDPRTLTSHATAPVTAPAETTSTKSNTLWSRAIQSLRREFVDTIPNDPVVRRHSTQITNCSTSFEETEVWDRKTILCIDGGGIRGYSALLIIRELMREIGRLEILEPADPDGKIAASSYHPLTPALSLITDDDSCQLQESLPTPPTDTSAWLPCHYFDYIAGTSTGGLIGIMLGRLRMNIDDCITDYEKLGAKVFARSRLFHVRSPLWLPREKYDHKVLEQVVQEVVAERVPKIGTFPGGRTFAFDENRCRVVAVSYQEQEKGQAEVPYLFRTYKNLRRGDDAEERLTDRNPGPAHDLPIWQVALATSAAPTYFKEAVIEGRKYIDGAFGVNNPTMEMFEEVRQLNNYNDKCIRAIISIGTGRSKSRRITHPETKRDKIKQTLQAGLGKFLGYENFARKWASESEKPHQDMVKHLKPFKPEKPFSYHRFNVQEGLDAMKLDDWRERSRLRMGIGKLLARMSTRCNTGTKDIEKMRLDRHAVNNGNETEELVTDKAEAALTGTPTASNAPSSSIRCWFEPRNKTLEILREKTSAYLDDPEVQGWIQECARILVNGRRGRASVDRQRWERACFGAWYQCNLRGCPRGEKEYPDRDAFRKHLLDKHKDVHHRRDEEGRRVLEAAIDTCKVVVH